jgi:DNA-binding LytR/AlgR family response regulator
MKKILIIEDDAGTSAILKLLFTINKFKAFTASNGTDGVNLVKEIKPDLILCDIRMPGMDGYDVKNTLGSCADTAAIPFIFLSAKNELRDIRYGLNLGADDYLTKPFNEDDLFEAIKIRLRRINELQSAYFYKKSNAGIIRRTGKKMSEKEQILVYAKGKPEIIKITEIVVIYSVGDYSNVICSNGRKIFTRKLLRDWEKVLPKKLYFRARRSAIINLNYIVRIDKWFSHTMMIKLEKISDPVIISQRNCKVLKQKLAF